eukprot:TRINITY_DN2252_c1_g1_i1.p1 TRINITY_DN2252_c1_g1~~TRINITY_DN2252_c1_g1_i1.p1  ORF type:complete len:566 (+),score=72.19 TRINITY_DN2252_c1_g1_i1:74-1699(+)
MSKGRMHFEGRSLSVVNDFTPDEQFYLYEQTRLLKEAVRDNCDISVFQIKNASKAVYLIFMEDSTRTKESFRNAALFHGCKVNVFDAATSSFNKKESITDTVKMLCGYSTNQSIFIVRSKLEGTCTWLDQVVGPYCESVGLPRASFINAGDGRHEHPTQEFLDEFSFLEEKNWDQSQIHLALVGDLYHGRTVHSKTDGLRVFKKVKVDLVAPKELAMPIEYINRMKENNFEVREFSSIDEYIEHGDVSALWYFTRLQLERMGDKILGREEFLRRAVTFKKSHIPKIPAESKFYHPLPRHQVYPVIPSFLDNTSFNAWDRQSINGYYTRIMELALVGGAVGADFKGQAAIPSESPNFVEEIVNPEPDLSPKSATVKKNSMKIGIKPVSNGLVIDHIRKGSSSEKCWKTISMIIKILELHETVGSCGVYASSADSERLKGLISLPLLTESFFDRRSIKKLAAISPGCTLNVICDDKVVKKYRLAMPPRIYDFEDIDCVNANCISHRKNHEHVRASFVRKSTTPPVFTCTYCERPHQFEDIWSL